MDGFIPGSRGSFMLDVVVLGMMALLPLVWISIWIVRRSKAYKTHRNLMVGLSIALAVVVVLFELEMRLIGWRHLAQVSPFYDSLVPISLGIHLFFAITTFLSLTLTIFQALKRFDNPPRPNEFSQKHKLTGKAAAYGLTFTSISGWIFYYLAFVATN
jgi:hypothetical protein